jgi:ADP-L-glycero-D-manno-heptose 6-epimerase
MIIVTGGAGFIGSNLIHGLNDRGLDNILLVDDLSNGDQVTNVQDCEIEDYMDKDEFISRLDNGIEFDGMSAIFHQGACSDTMERDGQFIMENNYDYSKTLLHYAANNGIPFIYASSGSVYGNGTVFRESPEYESALNAYAYSKLLFDRYVRKRWSDISSQVVGLRYFNVYGKGEAHKGRMASVAWHFYNQFLQQGHVDLFEGNGGYGDGEQRRDFVLVDDVVTVNLHFLSHPENSGIFNVGTGQSQSFNEVAATVLNTVNGEEKSAADWVASKQIRYIPFPDTLLGKYQSYTEADLTELTIKGDYSGSFSRVEEGVAAYVRYLQE